MKVESKIKNGEQNDFWMTYRVALEAPRSSVRIWPPRQKTSQFVGSFCFMKSIVYILFSESKSKYYSGHTQDLDNRLVEHNSGETISIQNGIPWKVIWTVALNSRAEAMKVESKIKKRGAKRFLDDLSRGA